MSKISNAIVIGGPIAVGKSTLVGALPFEKVNELETNDEFQDILLNKMYEGDIFAPLIFQLDIMHIRYDKYKEFADKKDTWVFDRSIFEDKLFADLTLKGIPNFYQYYKSILSDLIQEVIDVCGKPKLYIYLECSWETFEERVFARNREAEIKNFEENKEYFRRMIDAYPQYMRDMFETFDIDNIIIDTNSMSKIEVIEQVKSELSERGIL